MTAKLLTILLVGVLLGAMQGSTVAQKCGCAKGLCCSKYGYCGTGKAYCGAGCKSGPCHSSGGSSVSASAGSESVADVVTQSFFNGIINQAAGNCEGKPFYTRAAFVTAVDSYPRFGQDGSTVESKREIAAFFAHVTHETAHFCYINEVGGSSQNYCDNSQYGCAAGKKYYGRGPLQMSWNYNYALAGRSVGFNGLNNPGIVSTNVVISFKTALWFWMENVHSVMNQGFGASIRAINSMECNGGKPSAVNARVKYYRDYCNEFGISPGNNLDC